MTFRRVLRVAALVLSIACMAGIAAGADYRYVTIDVPGAKSTQAYRINARGDIVGRFTDSTGDNGFLLSAGTLYTIRIPGSVATYANGINDRGDIVGIYRTGPTSPHGFLLQGSTLTTIDVPGASGTRAWDINASGEVAGEYQDPDTRTWRGFTWRDGEFAYFDVSDSNTTSGFGINAEGAVVGHFTTPGSKMKGYVYSNGQFTTIDNPASGSMMSCAFGIGVHGEAVGHYADPLVYYADTKSYGVFGEVYRDGVFEKLQHTDPLARETTAESIAPNGAIVGYNATYDASAPAGSKWHTHGFLAIPLNPAGR